MLVCRAGQGGANCVHTGRVGGQGYVGGWVCVWVGRGTWVGGDLDLLCLACSSRLKRS